ncbi:MAG TPA: class I SAM-dependent methyltransferase [Candidatus Saccharimonadales bacterium]|nr:class I SAM-dependent methyltransferase [Candidatus Saccharimonadales bacterium]
MLEANIKSFYETSLKKYGLYGPRSIAWNSLESQITRFKVLSEITQTLDNQSILDVGSGLGDFYHYLNKNFKNIDYTGCEFTPESCNLSKVKYPQIRVHCADFLEQDFGKNYDYVFCSGALNIEMPNHKEYVKKAISKMFFLANKGVAFNLPSKYSELAKHNAAIDEEHQEIKIAYMDPCEMFDWCKNLTFKVTLRHDYMSHDFTIYLYH